MSILTPNILNTIRLLDPEIELLVTDKTTIDCPHCSQKLFLRPIKHPRYFICKDCLRAFDAVTLHMIITGTGDLESSIKEIVQNKGLIGKVNKTNIDKILTSTCAPFAGYNKIVEYTDKMFSGNEWLSEYGHILTARGIYTGSRKTDVATLRAVMKFWSCDDVGVKKAVGIQRNNPMTDQKVGKKVAVVPSWGLSGPAAYWMLSAEKNNLFHTLGSTTGGIAYLYETQRYKKVLATQHSGVALEMQARHYNKFKIHAPVILYNNRTSREEWEMLGDRKVVFLDALRSPLDNTIYQPAFDLPRGFLSAASSKSLREDKDYSKMHAALLSGKTPYDTCVSRDANRKLRDFADRDFLRTLDLRNFFERTLKSRGPSNLNSLDLGWAVDPGNRINYRGDVIEATQEGYVVVNDYGPDIISNFTVDLHGLYRLQEEDNMIYTGTIRIDDKMVPVVFDYKDISSTGHKIESVFQKTTVDAGVGVVPFLSYGWSRKIADIVKLFSPDIKAQIVCESTNIFNRQLDTYYFPGFTLTGPGVLSHQDYTTDEAQSVGLHHRYRRVDKKEISRYTRATAPILMEILTYVAYALLAQKHDTLDVKPLLIERSGKKNSVISRLIPRKIGGVKRAFIRELTPELKDKYANTFTIMELDNIEQLGAEGYGYALSESIPTMTTALANGNILEDISTQLIVRTLRVSLRDEASALEDVRKVLYDFLEGYTGTAEDPLKSLEHGILTKDECIQVCIERGIELNPFVSGTNQIEEIEREG